MKYGLDVALIDQPNGGRDDRVSDQLAQRGHNLIWVRPADGDVLPDVDEVDACVCFGGSGSANDSDAGMLQTLHWVEEFVDSGKPFFGICLGAQVLARAMGAKVYGCEIERGFTDIHPPSGGNAYFPKTTPFYQWHKETFDIPKSARAIGVGDVVPNQAFEVGANQIAVQFHPDVRYQTCLRWLTQQRDLWPQEKIELMETHLPQFQEHDAAVDGWVAGILDGWEGDFAGLGRDTNVRHLSARGLQGR